MMYETFFIGLILAVLYVEIMDIYPGGIIVPAYIALYLDQPLRVLATVLISLLSLLTYRFLSRFFILFGRRRFVMLLLLGALWGQLLFLIMPNVFAGAMEFRMIGWVIPGLLANNCEKQRIWATLASLFTVSVLTYFVAKLVTILF
ncbi:MAG: poly-gamma-glutamate biosynthesis protein PgsC [Candidatus Aminicenantes bacterium]|nr:MAG: poly-gamma-glutamate biosynthesis protein PgsC [Candidatus Aminicenantes bacterium]